MKKLLLKLSVAIIWLLSLGQKRFFEDAFAFAFALDGKVSAIEKPALSQKISEFFFEKYELIISKFELIFLWSEILFIVGMIGNLFLYFVKTQKLPNKLRKILKIIFSGLVVVSVILIALLLLNYLMN